MLKDILLYQISDAIVNNRSRVIDALNQSGIPTDSSISSKALAEKVMENIGNKVFIGKISSLIAIKNKGDFEGFANASGSGKGKVNEKHFVHSIYSEITGNITAEDKDHLLAKTDDMGKDVQMTKQVGAGINIIGLLLTLGLTATAIYVVVKWKPKMIE